jgi:hypothetical protein
MKLHYPKSDRLNYKESIVKWEDNEFPYQPCSCIEESNHPEYGVKLLIGYYKDGGCIFISNGFISEVNQKDKVEGYKVSNQEINNYYNKAKRPSDEHSIFRKPKSGDTLLCVAEGRYGGCKFGETYVVDNIGEDERVSFTTDVPYTYDYKYFIVVDTKSLPKSDDIIDVRGSTAVIFESDVDAMRYGAMSFKILDDDELIVRKKLEDTEPERRKIYSSELLIRK